MSTQQTADETIGTTDPATIDERMPDTVATKFMETFGRTFACPECGAASGGTCPECGHTHQALRDTPGDDR